ncbi:serine hydrolase domain-containing protein [Sulfitobacter sp. JB4-11]|uniref:serine hydrolase domain-containing protein n=1 Tax=Sulfitobacter rhodophyticola TaxID=3238304 RepID=UPI003511F2DB
MSSAVHALDLSSEVQKVLDGYRIAHGFPGATVAYVLPDGTVETLATGLADAEARHPMTPQTRMLAGSIGKTFVGAMSLSLEAEGLINLDAPISHYLGEHDWFIGLPNHDSMTVRDILHHSAGLLDHVHTEAFAEEMRLLLQSGEDAPPPEEMIGLAKDSDPLFAAGTGWAYSDTGYLLLGLMIEQVTGRPYYDTLHERFLKPLDLSETEPSDQRTLAGLAVGYTDPDNAFGMPPRTMDREGRLLWDPAIEWTGGGLVSTSRDLARWGHALFSGTAMAEPYLDDLLDGISIAPDTPEIKYGAGVAIYSSSPYGPIYGHGGWVPGYVSSLRHYADANVTIAFQINTDIDTEDLVASLEKALADVVIPGLHD